MSTAAEARASSAWLALWLAALVALWALRDLVMLVVFAILVAYLLDPIVGRLERVPLPRERRLSRGVASGLVMLAIFLGIGWVLSLAVPRLVQEVGHFVGGLPTWIETLLTEARRRAEANGLGSYVDPSLEALRRNAPSLLQQAGTTLLQWIGHLFGGLVLVGAAVLPLLAFYLLAEREDVKRSALRFVPEDAHDTLDAATAAVDRALRSYVRGQALVCLIMGTTVGVVLAVLGFPVALLLGVIVGLAEVIPYLGFAAAAAAIVIAGVTVDPVRAALGLLAYVVLNNLIGILVTPRVMGRHLQMHPFVVTVSVLAGGQLLGPAGALLALPAAASAQALIQEFGPPRAGRGRKR